ncbi:MAG: sugar phosphate isomerase/epimerase family protein, partial [Anaerolineae bacterium]
MKQPRPLLGCTSMVLWGRTLAAAAAALAAAGFQSIEIWAEHLKKSGEPLSEVAAALRSQGLRCTLHCPIIDVNICSTNEAIAETSRRLYLEALEAARQLEAQVFVFHAGNLFSTFDPVDRYWRELERFLGELAGRNAGGPLIAVENMEIDKPQEVVKSAPEIRRLLGAHGQVGLGVCWDTTHLINLDNNRRFLEEIPRVDHVHLSDARFTEGAPARKHLRLGQGNLDLAGLFAHPRAREARIVSLETVLIEPTVAELTE